MLWRLTYHIHIHIHTHPHVDVGGWVHESPTISDLVLIQTATCL